MVRKRARSLVGGRRFPPMYGTGLYQMSARVSSRRTVYLQLWCTAQSSCGVRFPPAVPQCTRVGSEPVIVPVSFPLLWRRGRRSFPFPSFWYGSPSSLKSTPVIGASVCREWVRRKASAHNKGGRTVYLCHIIKEEELIIHKGHHHFPYSIFPITGIWNKQQSRISFISCFSFSAPGFYLIHLFSQQSPAQHALPDTLTDLRKWGKHKNEPENLMNANKDWLRNGSH